MQKNRTLIFCGLSHLSINYGVSAAKLNQKIIFFDTKKKINNFHNKKIKFEEPNLYTYLNEDSRKISNNKIAKNSQLGVDAKINI